MKHAVRSLSFPSFSLRPVLLGLGVSLFGFEAEAQTPCPSNPTYTYTVGCNLAPNGDADLNEGQSLYIPAGVTYTGSVKLNGNATGRTIYNYGTWTPNDNNFIIQGATTIYNYQGATANFQNVNFNGSDSRLYNSGVVTSGTISAGGLIRNGTTGSFNASQITLNSGGQLDNLGRITSTDIINNAIVTNCGTIQQALARGSFTNSGSGVVKNFGTFAIGGDFDNNGDFQGATLGGTGVVRVAGESRQNGGGRFGAVGRLDFCDASSSNGGRFDVNNNGVIGSSVTYCTPNPSIAGCTTSPLPVELTSFDAKLSKGSVLLTWTTASEKNNEKFVVERSADGESFEALTEVAGHGTSSSSYSYRATDVAPLAGTSYYRLRQVDFDGVTVYSPVLTIQNAAANQTNKLGIYPNPATDYITLDLPKEVGETYEVRISTVSGKLVRRLNLSGSSSQLDLHALPAGTYLLQVRSANTQTVQRLIKQ